MKNRTTLMNTPPKTRIIFCLLGVLFVSTPAFASLQSYPLSLDVKSIRISARNASLSLLPLKPKSKSVLIKGIRAFKVQQEGSLLVIFEEGFPEQTSPLTSGQNQITVHVPPLPVTVVLFKGGVVAKKVRDLSIFIAGRGEVKTKNTKGDLLIAQKEGRVNVDSHKGALNIQAEKASTHIQDSRGDVVFRGFKGRLQAKNLKGSLWARMFKLHLDIRHFTGDLNFRQEQGGVTLKDVKGSLTGYSRLGEVRGTVQASKVNIETDTGPIRLNMPHSRAYLRAWTSEGRLFTPVYLSRTKTGGMDRAQGQLRGGKQAGQVFLKSRTGSIKVYQAKSPKKG